MIDIDSVYRTIQDLLRKNQQGYLTPAEYNRYANIANKARFNELYGPAQQERSGKPIREGYDQNQQIDEKLAPFVVRSVFTIGSTGHAARPSDLLRMDAVLSASGGSMRRVNKDSEGSWATNKIMPPTIDYPFYVDYGLYYQFYPFNPGLINFSYLSQPGIVKWAYVLDGNGRPIYDPTNAVHFKWEDNEIGNIIAKILEYAGKSVADMAAVQLAAQLDTKGQ